MQRVMEGRIQTVCLAVLASVAIAGALYWLKPVMIPFVLAVLLTYALAPLVDLLHDRLRIPRIVAIGIALLLGFALLTLLAGLISGSLRRLAEKLPMYEARFHELAQQATAWLAAKGFDVGADSIEQQVRALPLEDMVLKATGAVVDLVSNTFLVLIFSIYLLAGHRADAPAASKLRATIDVRIRRYITMKVILSAATGLLVGVFLGILGVELAMVFGVMAFVLNFIPNVGSIIATLLPLPIVLFDPEAGLATVVLTLALPGTVQMLVGNVIEPKVMGDSLELHPITVLLTLIFWGMLWGIPGMLLATPITAIIKLLLGELELTRPVARLMAGELPGSAPETN